MSINVKEFLEKLNRYRVQYFGLEECLNKGSLSVGQVEEIYKQKNYIAEKIARFVLYPDMDAEILFNRINYIEGKILYRLEDNRA